MVRLVPRHGEERVVPRGILRDVVDVVARLGGEAGDIDRGIRIGADRLRAVAHAVDAVFDLAAEVFLKEHPVFGALLDLPAGGLRGGGGRVEVIGPRAHGDPIERAVLVEVDAQAQVGRADVRDLGRVVLELGRRAVHRRERELLHRGGARAVGVHQAQVEVVGRRLLQAAEGQEVEHVLGRVDHAALQRTAERADAELLRRGRGAAAVIERVVEHAALVGHVGDLDTVIVAVCADGVVVLRDGGVAGVEGGRGVVRRRERRDLDRAVPVAGVHHDGGEVVVAVRREARERRRRLGVGGGDRGAAAQHRRGVALGRRDQLVFADGAVGRGADRPIDRAALVRGEYRRRAGRRDVPRLRIAREQARIGGGFLRLRRVHRLAGDVGGEPGADRDLVGQHLDDGARRVDVQVINVAVAGDGRRGVEVERHRRAVDVEVERGAGRRLVDGERVHRAHRDVQRGAGRFVDDGLQIAGEREARAGVDGFERNVEQPLPGTGAVLHERVGAERRVGDLRIALGAHRDKLVGDAVDQQRIGDDVAQHDAVLAAVALAAAGDDDVAEHADVVEGHVAEVEAAGDVQIARDGGVFERRAGRADRHVAVRVGEGVRAGFVDERAERALEHDRHLAAADVVLRLVSAVAVAADEPRLRGGAGVAAAPFGEAAAVGKLGDLAADGVEAHVAREQHHRHLAGERAVRRGHARRNAVEVMGVVGDADVIVIPCVRRHVAERRGAGVLVAVGAVDHRGKFRAGEVALRMRAAVGIAGDDAPIHELVHRALADGGGRAREYGAEGNGHTQDEQKRRELAREILFHSVHVVTHL